MALSDLKVFSSYVQGSMTETLAENVELFNAATNGGMQLSTKANDGDYADETMWKSIAGLVRNRNSYGSGAVTPLDLSQRSDTSVKVGAGAGPVVIDPGMLRWIGKNPEEAGTTIGAQLAEARLQNMVESGVGAFVAAISQNSANYLNALTRSASLGVLNEGAAKLGDQSGNLAAWVMHSTAFHDIYGDGLANAARLFTYGTVSIIADPLGRPLIMSDNASLTTAEGAAAGIDSYSICGLQNAAIVIQDNGDYDSNTSTLNGDENIGRSFQAEWSFNTQIRGYAWDKANGGASPTLAAITTSTNWDKQGSYDKDLAGVVVEVRAAADVV